MCLQLETLLAEEKEAKIHGWDFSSLDGRYHEDTDFPWNYKNAVLDVLDDGMKLLDIDTGGGEILLSLGHPAENTAATEGYAPNVTLCREVLGKHGIDFREGHADKLPFADDSFDIITNRHGDLCASEIHRVLRQGGTFITQQVGAENDRELVSLLLPENSALPFPDQYLDKACDRFVSAGFEISEKYECKRTIRFFDVGALTRFARIIEWEFVGFSAEKCYDRLLMAQKIIDETGYVEGHTHRFFIKATKRY